MHGWTMHNDLKQTKITNDSWSTDEWIIEWITQILVSLD